MEDLKYYNLKEFAFDLAELLQEVADLREENATLKKQVADYDDFVRRMNERNQNFIGETIKQLIEEVK